MASLLSPIYPNHMGYLVHLLVFLHKFLEVGTRVAQLLLAGVEDYLTNNSGYHLLTAHQIIFQIYYLNKIKVRLSLFQQLLHPADCLAHATELALGLAWGRLGWGLDGLVD